MKRLITILFAFSAYFATAQQFNAAYVKALYQKYPTQKSDFCPACKLWVNPYYKSIADTERHAPLLTYYIYTKAHRLQQETANVPRVGIYATWHPAYGQPDETKVYKQANVESPDMIAKGHCQAWILLAYDADGAIFSDTYTFNAGMEYQGQNVGTEIATEELCRKLTGYRVPAVTDSVKIWCGTFGSKQTYTAGNITVTMPAYYYKIIQYPDRETSTVVTQCYWMPNLPTEKRALLPQRLVDHAMLVGNLGFDPLKVLN
jgi:hypothetical protein